MSRTVNADNPKHWFIPFNGKIADITHADTLQHLLVLANAAGTGAIAGETRKIIGINLYGVRMAGTGFLFLYPNEGVFPVDHSTGTTREDKIVVILNNSQRIQYNLTVANDDFDVYCMGYVVEV